MKPLTDFTTAFAAISNNIPALIKSIKDARRAIMIARLKEALLILISLAMAVFCMYALSSFPNSMTTKIVQIPAFVYHIVRVVSLIANFR